jgi:hypothetical protein
MALSHRFPLLMLFILVGAASADAHTLTMRVNRVDVVAVEEPFRPAAHRIEGCNRPYQGCKIDGTLLIGLPAVPTKELTRLAVTCDGKTYELDTSGMFGPLLPATGEKWQGHFSGFCYDRDNCGFRGVFSDAGGSYAAEWLIRNGVARRTVLSDSGDVVQFFLQYPNPPKYN